MLRRNVLLSSFLGITLFYTAFTAAETTDVSGTWQLTVIDTGRTFTPAFILEQDGETLSGKYRNSQGDNPAKGTVKGNVVTMMGEITSRDGQKRWVTYVGTVNGDSMNGIFETTRAEVKFTATREAE